MPQTLLGSLAIAYQPLWGKSRSVVGVRLAVSPVPGGIVDALHLLQVLRSFWPHKNAALVIAPSSFDLLCTLLQEAPAYSPCIEVPDEWLQDPMLVDLVRLAHLRGLPMVWRGPNEGAPEPDLAPCFKQQLLNMDAQDTLEALRMGLAPPTDTSRYSGFAPQQRVSPVQPFQLYEGIASRALIDHCLDQQQVAAIIGWPEEEVLHAYRHAAVLPSARSLQRVINAANADVSTEVLENLLSEDPVLAYRLLIHVNSAAMGLRGGINSLRRAVIMLGISALKDWCQQQLPHANDDRNLHPVRSTVALRASLMEYLLDAGDAPELRREINLCGLFSQLDAMLGDPLEDLLGRIPVAERIVEAVATGTGAYAPYLLVAKALQASSTDYLPALCESFEMSLDDVNRALLRTLGVAKIGSHAL